MQRASVSDRTARRARRRGVLYAYRALLHVAVFLLWYALTELAVLPGFFFGRPLVVLQRVWPFAPTVYASAAVVVLSLALTMELWLAVESSKRRLARAFLLPGLGLQRLTTREPKLEETRIALRAVQSVLRRELSA